MNISFNVEVVNYTPFERALSEGFEIGARSNNCRWIGFLDADVILIQSEIKSLLNYMSASPFGIIQGYVYDKYFGQLRSGGLHIYPQNLMSDASKLIPQLGKSIRPETATKMKFAQNGIPLLQVPFIIGLHDYFQWQKDIERKARIYAVKKNQSSTELIKFWKDRACDNENCEYKQMLKSFVLELGDVNNKVFAIDSSQNTEMGSVDQVGTLSERWFQTDRVKVEKLLKGITSALIRSRYTPITIQNKLICLIFEINFFKGIGYFSRRRFKSLRLIIYILARKGKHMVLF